MTHILNRRHRQAGKEPDRGFTLVEILIAIVLIGVLSAVVVVGISSLTDEGSDSACEASLDAAKAGAVVYYASHDNTYPTTFTEMTNPSGEEPNIVPAALTLPSGASVVDETTIEQSDNWTLTMTPSEDGSTAPTFTCS